jgi:hypothetical protein
MLPYTAGDGLQIIAKEYGFSSQLSLIAESVASSWRSDVGIVSVTDSQSGSQPSDAPRSIWTRLRSAGALGDVLARSLFSRWN